MKSKTIVKILIASLIAIIIGISITFASYFADAKISISQLQFGPFSVIQWDKDSSKFYGVSETFHAKSDIQKLELDLSLGHVTIMSGDQFSIRTLNVPTNRIQTSESNGTYSFSITNSKLSIPFTNDYEIVVTIPENVNVVQTRINAGSLEISHLTLQQLKVDVDAGNVDIENTIANDISLSINLGELGFEGDVSNQLKVENNAGDVELQLRQFENNYNFDLAVDAGLLEVNDHDYGNINAAYKRNNNKTANIKANVNLGNLSLSCGFDD